MDKSALLVVMLSRMASREAGKKFGHTTVWEKGVTLTVVWEEVSPTQLYG